MSEQFPADPAAITAHALRIFPTRATLSMPRRRCVRCPPLTARLASWPDLLLHRCFSLWKWASIWRLAALSAPSTSSVRRSWPARAVQVGESSRVTIPEAGAALWGDGRDS